VIGFDGRPYDFYVRQLWDGKGAFDMETMDESAWAPYAHLCAWTLAKAHAHTGDRIAIAGPDILLRDPFVLGLVPRVRVPSAVAELMAGIAPGSRRAQRARAHRKQHRCRGPVGCELRLRVSSWLRFMRVTVRGATALLIEPRYASSTSRAARVASRAASSAVTNPFAVFDHPLCARRVREPRAVARDSVVVLLPLVAEASAI
jgi:hypothetical protein